MCSSVAKWIECSCSHNIAFKYLFAPWVLLKILIHKRYSKLLKISFTQTLVKISDPQALLNKGYSKLVAYKRYSKC